MVGFNFVINTITVRKTLDFLSSANMANNRAITPMLAFLRDKLLRTRNYKDVNRFPNEQASRDPPLPKLPDGPSAKLADNYYYTRDGRGIAEPPAIIFENTTLRPALTAGETSKEESTAPPKKRRGPTVPGFSYPQEMTPKTYNLGKA